MACIATIFILIALTWLAVEWHGDYKCKVGIHSPYDFEGKTKCGRCGVNLE